MSPIVRVCTVAALASALMVGGCRKKQPALEDMAKPVPKPDTSFTAPRPFEADTSDNASFREAELDAELMRQVRENLRTVYFEFNSYSLSETSIDQLRTAANFLMRHSTMRVLVEGHCDERGSSEYNMGLGENRARAVKNYLVNYGIPSVQIETTSWGKERPAMSGCVDESCHSQNRRAEFKVLAK